jgi:hypothetical protein
MNDENTSNQTNPPELPLNPEKGKKETKPAPPDPSSFDPPKGPMGSLEMLLRQPAALIYHMGQGQMLRISMHLILIVIVTLGVFGAVLGLFSGGTQLWAAPAKITLGTLFSAAICLPSLYIFSCLSGIEVKWKSLIVYLLGMVALIGILLLGFAPVSWVFSQSTDSVSFFGFLNLIFWTIGLFFGAGFLKKAVGKQSGQIVVWFFVFILVCLQMTATLRPIIGQSDDLLPQEKKFFLTHWFETMDGGESSSY